MNSNDNNSRRDFLKKSALFTIATTGIIASSGTLARAGEATEKFSALMDASKFTLPALPYAYDALEPHIDKMTMEIHHDRHHQAYVDNLNKALATHPELMKKTIDAILRDIQKVPKDVQTAVINNGGGHFNHTLFWEIMGPKGGGE